MEGYFFIDVVADFNMRIIFLSQPVQDICHQLKIRSSEVLDTDDTRVAQCSHLLTEIP